MKLNLRRVLWGIGFAVMAALAVYDAIMVLTPAGVPGWGRPPSNPGKILPLTLDCSIINTNGPGPQWNGLTIGESRFWQVKIRFGLTQPEWDEWSGNLHFYNPEYPDGQPWGFVDTCFIGDTVVAMNVFGAPEFKLTIDQMVESYGKPDKVTWGSDYFTRSIIWARKGMLVLISIEQRFPYTVILFPYMTEEELTDSWLLKSLPTSLQPNKGDFLISPDLEVENPWGI